MLYDCVQLLAGQPIVLRHIKTRLSTLSPSSIVLDLGGGTGLYRTIWPQSATYICLDLDAAKLRGYRARYPSGLAILADGGKLPLPDSSIDFVTCIAVAHHLPDDMLASLLHESRRVLRPAGRFVFLDPLRSSRLASRALWRIDRGSQARNSEELQSALARVFCPSHSECFTVIHQYLLWIGSSVA